MEYQEAIDLLNHALAHATAEAQMLVTTHLAVGGTTARDVGPLAAAMWEHYLNNVLVRFDMGEGSEGRVLRTVRTAYLAAFTCACMLKTDVLEDAE